jgi:alditol oxidase
MMREHNWANNYTFGATRIHRPESVDAARRLVADARHIRALGTRHSFNGIADSSGGLIDLGGIDPGFLIDPRRRTVTVGGATNYGSLAVHLDRAGWALHNMASLPHVSVAGAVATGTHGSGDGLGNLASAVAALEIITATGDLVAIGRGDPGFEGVVVGLGAFGIVTRVTLDIRPAFDLRQDAFEGLPWAVVLADLDRIMSAGYSVSLMTSWSGPLVTRLWIKTQIARGIPETPTPAPPPFGTVAAPQPSARSTPEGLQRLNPFGIRDSWRERLPHFRADAEPGPPGHLQSEYMVPRRAATEAIATLQAIGGRIDRHLWATEIRSIAGDRQWLSPAYGDDRIAIHFSWLREPDAVAAMTEEIEAMLLPLGARPHWGKIMHAPAPQLSALYPKLPEFRELARSYDSGAKFGNEFLDRHVFG